MPMVHVVPRALDSPLNELRSGLVDRDEPNIAELPGVCSRSEPDFDPRADLIAAGAR